MFSAAIIIFREVLEIAMILGVVLAATRGLPARSLWIGLGFAAGGAGAGLVALFAQTISQAASGMGQELFNALILFTAALVIGWTAIWMRSHAREFVSELRQTGQDVITGKLPGLSLSLIIGLALLREGSEIVLFIYGMILSHQTPASILAGSIAGLVLGTIAGAMLYMGLIKMSAKHMLTVTGWLLILLVAGLSSQGAGYLIAAGYFSQFAQPVWNTSWLLSQDSILGKALHSLIGYSDQPSFLELFFYVATLLGLFSLIALTEKHRNTRSAAVGT